MFLNASPIELVDAEHAVTIGVFGPFNPYLIEIAPPTILIIDLGIKNGEIRLGPLLAATVISSAKVSRPPIPLVKYTPNRYGSNVKSTRLACSIASFAARRPYKITRSFLLISDLVK